MGKHAEVGDTISFNKDAVKGVVDKVNDNSVIVTITENRSFDQYAGNRTVVNHKNYKILK